MNLAEALEGVTGFFNGLECQLLHDLAAEIRLPQMIVEIGSFQGKSLICLALDAQTPVFSVDPHVQSVGDPYGFGDQDRAALMANLVRTGLAWKVRILDMQSEWAARGWPGHHIGLLFIDGSHDLASIRMDLNGWLPFVDDGATVCFHDMVGQAIQDAIAERGDVLTFVKQVELTGMFRYNRPKPAPAHKIEQVVGMEAMNGVELLSQPIPEHADESSIEPGSLWKPYKAYVSDDDVDKLMKAIESDEPPIEDKSFVEEPPKPKALPKRKVTRK